VPASPRLLSTLLTGGSASRIALYRDYAIIADGPAGLKVANIANPRAPYLMASHPTRDDALDVSMAGTRPLVAGAAWGLEIFRLRLNSPPSISSAALQNGRLILKWENLILPYRLQRSESLDSASWADVIGSEFTTAASLPAAVPRQFFRLAPLD
jgi:hypothetical protein